MGGPIGPCKNPYNLQAAQYAFMPYGKNNWEDKQLGTIDPCPQIADATLYDHTHTHDRPAAHCVGQTTQTAHITQVGKKLYCRSLGQTTLKIP